jgi:hypothetical protein
MLYRKIKNKMICFLEVMMVTWHREDEILRIFELEVSI